MHEYKHFIDPTVMQDSHTVMRRSFSRKISIKWQLYKAEYLSICFRQKCPILLEPGKCKHRRLCNEQAVHRFYPDFIPYVRQRFLK